MISCAGRCRRRTGVARRRICTSTKASAQRPAPPRRWQRCKAMIGRTIGKYRFVSALGRGGMGTVYKAVDETLDREVAVKVLNAELLESDGVKRFRAEAVT